FHSGTAVPEDKTEGTKDFSTFVSKVGTTQTVLRPIGKAMFDGVVLDVVARDGFIEKGKTVQVIAVEGQKIEVIEIQED
ncbi:MAG: nodulation efficiency protein NfeD, partial [Clostridia bacterium]|nr:nodulation efficiency protein NfeD [Clostridia bacterium]